MNSVLVLGNLTRDVIVKRLQNDNAVANFTLAVTDTWSFNGETKTSTQYVPIVAWGNLAKSIEDGRKGEKVFVEGKYTTRSYEDKDGNKKYVTEVVARLINIQTRTNETVPISNFEDEDIPF